MAKMFVRTKNLWPFWLCLKIFIAFNSIEPKRCPASRAGKNECGGIGRRNGFRCYSGSLGASSNLVVRKKKNSIKNRV